MEPLSPRDLLLRQTSLDGDQWDGEAEQNRNAMPPVALERFQALEHTIADTPLHVDAYLELSNIYLQNQRWNDAKRVLDGAVKRFPDDEEVNFLREEAQVGRSLQLFATAEAEYAAEPTRLTSESLDRCRIELNVLRERVCCSRLQRHPEQVELNIPLAIAMENLDKRAEAIKVLQKAVAVPKLRAEAALQLGGMLERARRIPEALSAFRRAAFFRVPPPSYEIKYKALSAAADLAQRSNMVDSARRYVAKLIELAPQNEALKARLSQLTCD